MKRNPKKALEEILELITEYDLITVRDAEKLEARDNGIVYLDEGKIYRLDLDLTEKRVVTIHELLHTYYFKKGDKRYNNEKKINKETRRIFKYLFGK